MVDNGGSGGGGGGGGAGGTREQRGPTEHRTILRLEPITYQISLIYLGNKRVRHADGYRCAFELKSGKAGNPAQAGLPALDPITNIVDFQPPAPAPSPPAEGGGGAGDAGGGGAADAGGGEGGAGGGGAAAAAPVQIPAALPLTQGGDNSNLNPDQYLRVVVLDNHGMRMDGVNGSDGTSNTGLLGSGGNTQSKVQNYNRHNFNEEIFPDVCFRVVVRRFVGNQQANLTPDDLRVLWEVKDPEEELDQVPAGRGRRWLNGFFGANTRDSALDGDDNCSTTFGRDPVDRLRTPSTNAAPQPAGVKADTILFAAPYQNRPPIDQVVPPAPAAAGPPAAPAPPANPLDDVLNHGDLATALTAHDTMRALSELTAVQETVGANQITVGVSDVAWRPYPIGGDNFRFLLTLTDPAGTDIRTRQENGRTVQIQDQARRVIPHPHCYTTGKFVMWRRINIRLLIRVNQTAFNAINWGTVQRRYDDAFVELGQPQQSVRLTRGQWRLALQSYFGGAGTWVPAAQINNNANYNAPVAYNVNFFPPFLHTPAGGVPAAAYAGNAVQRLNGWRQDLQFTHVEGASRQIVRDTCRRLGVSAPFRSTRQRDSQLANGNPDPATGTGAGFFIVLTKRFVPGSTLLGAYVGEQQFYMDDRFPTVTFAHELGHGVYLRHGQTTQADGPNLVEAWRNPTAQTWTYTPAGGGAAFQVQPYTLNEDNGNTYPLDHDANDTVECIMSYDNDNIPTDFCAMCMMILRYYDKVRLVRNEQRRITRGWRAAHVVEVRAMAGANNMGFFEAPNNLAKGGSINIATVADFETVVNDTGLRSAKLLNTLKGMSYAVAPAGQGVTIANSGTPAGVHTVNATAAATSGNYTITFTFRSTSASITVNVP